jgi:hypothetical protein
MSNFDQPYKSLAAAIILQAFEDTESLYRRIVKIRKLCKTEGQLYSYLYAKKQKEQKQKYSDIKPLPFENPSLDELSAVQFWDKSNWWSGMLMASMDINDLPKGLKQKADVITGYYKYCRQCVDKVKKRVNRDFRDPELEKILS